MAFHKIYCASCGLEIYPDEELIPYARDCYHGKPYDCYIFQDGRAPGSINSLEGGM